ncbi:MAG TPA: hypothetical protein VHE81_15405 [Lacipirellulaceae bacterium]|nr:hypothetical protein [Lacipirellulaceae bacterium]
MKLSFDRALRQEIVDHLVRVVETTPLLSEPFPHFVVQGFFPSDVYRRMLSSLPAPNEYEPFAYEKHHQQNGESNRRRFQMTNVWLERLPAQNREFWFSIRSALGSEELKRAAFGKLAPGLAFRYAVPAATAKSLPGYALPELFHETKGYSIKPHPDTRKKVVTMQIALPHDDKQNAMGTEFYRRTANPLALFREPRGFEIVKRMPFLPNTAYAFSVLNTFTLKSWHGRTEIAGECGQRNSLLNIWYEKPELGNTDLVAEQAALKISPGEVRAA